MGTAQEIITTNPNIGEKIAHAGTQIGSTTAIGSAATMIFGMPINEVVTMIVGFGGLIIAIMSYLLNAKYKRMHYELERDRMIKRVDEIEERRYGCEKEEGKVS